MDVKPTPGAIQASDADAIILNLFEEAEPDGATRAVDRLLDGAIGDLISGGDFSGKSDQVPCSTRAALSPPGA